MTHALSERVGVRETSSIVAGNALIVASLIGIIAALTADGRLFNMVEISNVQNGLHFAIGCSAIGLGFTTERAVKLFWRSVAITVVLLVGFALSRLSGHDVVTEVFKLNTGTISLYALVMLSAIALGFTATDTSPE